jgi:hypothetical protein
MNESGANFYQFIEKAIESGREFRKCALSVGVDCGVITVA